MDWQQSNEGHHGMMQVIARDANSTCHAPTARAIGTAHSAALSLVVTCSIVQALQSASFQAQSCFGAHLRAGTDS